MGSHVAQYAAGDDLECLMLLPPSPNCCDDKDMPYHGWLQSCFCRFQPGRNKTRATACHVTEGKMSSWNITFILDIFVVSCVHAFSVSFSPIFHNGDHCEIF